MFIRFPPFCRSLGVCRAGLAVAIAMIVLGAPGSAWASYAFYVGKHLTKNGATLIGGTGEEVSGHWLEIVPRQKHAPGSTIEVGASERARLPGELIKIPQVAETFKYITMNYSDFVGLPAPLTNGGLNEYQVAIRDIWAPTRPELTKQTPLPQHGTNYSDQARIALERARTAREAVRIIGALIENYGDVTYGGNSHLIADPNEGWVVLELAGGKGLWVAERLGPDDVRVSYPGYIGDLPADFGNNPNYMGSANLISFAVEQGWYDPKSGKPFNVSEVYRRPNGPMKSGFKYWAIEDIERELRERAPLSVQAFMSMVRDKRIADEEAGYGEVAELRAGIRPELALLWVAPTGSITAPFVPWYMGVTTVPPEFGLHRYLYKDAGSRFLNPDFQDQEATVFAGRVFKRLLYHTCAQPELFLPEVTAALRGFEAREFAANQTVEQTAEVLYKAGQPELAARYLTFYSTTQAGEALRLGEALVGSIEARRKVQFGLRKPAGTEINLGHGESPNCLQIHDPDVPASR